ncbi:MAG: zf-HC2 domain-containing protein [Burkholderiales bacterium]|nr:zf-HC2 domain-containing protein [Burkholderiales bacterium]
MKLLRTCREVAALISAREDRALSTTERVTLRAHAFICRRCTDWEKQVAAMRQSMTTWRSDRE